jgi:hypothetical protein
MSNNKDFNNKEFYAFVAALGRNTMNGDGQDFQPLLVDAKDFPVSPRTGVPLNKTVYAFLHSSNHEDNEKGIHFVRKILALLVLQYATVLFIVSPFYLIESFQRVIKPYQLFLSIFAFAGAAASVYWAFAKRNRPNAKIALFTISPCVALGLGLRFAGYSWASYVLVALGQATSNCALIHAIMQFDTASLKWLNYKTVMLIFLGVSGLWIVVMNEAGTSWFVSAAVGLGGWVYATSIVMSLRRVILHWEPDDPVRAAIVILGPPIADRLTQWFKKEGEPQRKTNYGGTDMVV